MANTQQLEDLYSYLTICSAKKFVGEIIKCKDSLTVYHLTDLLTILRNHGLYFIQRNHKEKYCPDYMKDLTIKITVIKNILDIRSKK